MQSPSLKSLVRLLSSQRLCPGADHRAAGAPGPLPAASAPQPGASCRTPDREQTPDFLDLWVPGSSKCVSRAAAPAAPGSLWPVLRPWLRLRHSGSETHVVVQASAVADPPVTQAPGSEPLSRMSKPLFCSKVNVVHVSLPCRLDYL